MAGLVCPAEEAGGRGRSRKGTVVMAGEGDWTRLSVRPLLMTAISASAAESPFLTFFNSLGPGAQ